MTEARRCWWWRHVWKPIEKPERRVCTEGFHYATWCYIALVRCAKCGIEDRRHVYTQAGR